ncbi:MAG: YebC/PmpR family DNA-binding transcriptional regulator [Phycisphaerales bacterium]|nr:YebC/PmpR family DNA-binding transcriptional regulator [Phycisphaerales bacterium]
MAGHSKWANIKHRKAAVDKKRGKIWSKCSRAIISAARQGGPDPTTNLTLRYAIDEAKAANMPKDTIQRAIDKGAGSSAGEEFVPVVFEGYAPGGVAIIVDALTDNNTRTFGEVRSIFTKYDGSLGAPGSVAFLFQTRGRILIEADAASEDRLMEIALEAGADDVEPPESEGDDPGAWTVLCEPAALARVKDAIESAGIATLAGEIAKIPTTSAAVSAEQAKSLLTLIDVLEDNDDVQKVYTNADFPQEVLDQLA